MKTILLLGCGIFALVLISCENPDKEPQTNLSETELQKPISDAARLKVIEDWQIFRKESSESMLLAQEKLDRLEMKLTDKETTQNIGVRRTLNSCGYKLGKLKSKFLRQGIKFRNNIGHYTLENVLKNESWRTGFNTKLKALHTELDEGLVVTPK